MAQMTGGVWRTIGGRRIFITEGKGLSDAMKESGKFKLKKKKEEMLSNKDLAKYGDLSNPNNYMKAQNDLVFNKGMSVKESEKILGEYKNTGFKTQEQKMEEAGIKFATPEQTKGLQGKADKVVGEMGKSKNEIENHKNEQFEIIQKYNPMQDDYHVGIRSPKDIKTWEEAMNDDESFAWGDFSKADAQKALESGEITIYSSYDIKQGTFVSTSKVQAEEYAGGPGSKVYSKKIPLNEVAWINGDEGQYAKVGKSRSSNNVYLKAYNEYMQEHPNSKITFTKFKENLK